MLLIKILIRVVSSAVERLPYKQRVTGSNPVLPIKKSYFEFLFFRSIPLNLIFSQPIPNRIIIINI